MLLALNFLTAALTCGDDGPLDYGTASSAVRRYCEISFDEHVDGTSHLSGAFTTLAILTLVAVAIVVATLLITRRRALLHAAIALLGAPGRLDARRPRHRLIEPR